MSASTRPRRGRGGKAPKYQEVIEIEDHSSDEDYVNESRLGETRDREPSDVEMADGDDADGEFETDDEDQVDPEDVQQSDQQDKARRPSTQDEPMLDAQEGEGGDEEEESEEEEDDEDEDENGKSKSAKTSKKGKKSKNLGYDISEEEIATWLKGKLEKLDKTISKCNDHVQEIEKRITQKEQQARDKEAEYWKEHEARNKGETQLQAILDEKATFLTAAEKLKEEDLQNAQARKRKHQARRQTIQDNAREEYIKWSKRNKKIQPPEDKPCRYNPWKDDDGNDSLSDQIATQTKTERERRKKKREKQKEKEEKENNDGTKKKGRPTKDDPGDDDDTPKNPQACRRCKLKKIGCRMAPGHTTCDFCASTDKLCRFTDHFSGRQVRFNALQITEDKLAAALKELENYRALSKVSVSSDNPLSGITGYGPPTRSQALQNWARMANGMEPLPPQAPATRDDSSESQTSKRKSPPALDDNEALPPPKRPKLTLPPPAPAGTKYKFHNNTVRTFGEPSNRRGRKPGQKGNGAAAKSTKPAATTQQQPVPTAEEAVQTSGPQSSSSSNASDNLTTHPGGPPTADRPQINFAVINAVQLWWARELHDRGETLPVDQNTMPRWPTWMRTASARQLEWLTPLVEGNMQVPIKEAGSQAEGDDSCGVEPDWPANTLSST